jgi:hypothetical protein
MLRKTISLIALMSVLLISGCSGTTSTPQTSATPPQATGDQPQYSGPGAQEIAQAVSVGVETLTQSSGGKGIPVIVQEERHNSRVGQLQHAASLARLHDKYGLRDIVLEGYLKDRSDINTDWFTKCISKKTAESRARVAIQFLKNGEISAAEFMKLVYPDITLHKAETSDNYNVEPPSSFAVIDYLKAIAQVDSAWAIEKSKPYQSMEAFQSLSGEEKLNLAKEIKNHAEGKSIAVSSEAKQSMEAYLNFMEKRLASNNTINDVITSVLASRTPKVVAVIIGADHTHGMSRLLSNVNRSFAVLKPQYTPGREEQGDLTTAMYERKNKRLPVFSQGLSALILQQVSEAKKPEPVIPEHWFEAEGEFNGFGSSVAEAILGAPSPPGPPNGGKPPFGLSDNDFDGRWIKIDVAKIEYLPNQNDLRRAVLIPLTFKRSGNIVWVGATMKRGQEQGQETVEAIITEALQDVKAEEKTPERAEDQTGRVQMSTRTFAVIGTNKEAVKQAIQSAV